MVWEPFALAVIMGLLVSAAIYFVVMWPQVEPEDEPIGDDAPPAEPAVGSATATGDGSGDALSSRS